MVWPLSSSSPCCCSPGPVRPGGAAEALDICSLVSSEQLAAVYRKPLYPTPQENGCCTGWEPGAMAYLHIGVHDRSQPLRHGISTRSCLPRPRSKPILDLGDEGLMSVVEGDRCGGHPQGRPGAAKRGRTFLDIKPGSDQQQALWTIYRDVLARIAEAHRPPPELPTRSTAS